jgi:hypothetical protein
MSLDHKQLAELPPQVYDVLERLGNPPEIDSGLDVLPPDIRKVHDSRFSSAQQLESFWDAEHNEWFAYCIEHGLAAYITSEMHEGVEPEITDLGRLALRLHEQTPQASPQSDKKSKTPAQPRLVVDLARKMITLDGKTLEIGSENALRWVKVLSEHPLEWISSSDLEKLDPELASKRTDRWKKDLPRAIRSLIDSDTGKGSRIRL